MRVPAAWSKWHLFKHCKYISLTWSLFKHMQRQKRSEQRSVMTGHYMNQRLLSKGSHFTTPGKNPWLKVAENTGCQVRQNMNTVIFIRTFCVSCDFLSKHIAGEQTRVMWRTNKTKCKFVHTRHQHRHYVYMGSMTKHDSRFAHKLWRLRDTFSLPANLTGKAHFELSQFMMRERIKRFFVLRKSNAVRKDSRMGDAIEMTNGFLTRVRSLCKVQHRAEFWN